MDFEEMSRSMEGILAAAEKKLQAAGVREAGSREAAKREAASREDWSGGGLGCFWGGFAGVGLGLEALPKGFPRAEKGSGA